MESKIETMLPVEVELGSPRNECRHFGICRVHFSISGKSTCGCRCPAILYKLKNGDIRFVFSKKNIPVKTWQKHFSNGIFRVDDAYVFEKCILGKMGMETFVIYPGKYPLKIDSGNIHLVFPIKEKRDNLNTRKLAIAAY